MQDLQNNLHGIKIYLTTLLHATPLYTVQWSTDCTETGIHDIIHSVTALRAEDSHDVIKCAIL